MSQVVENIFCNFVNRIMDSVFLCKLFLHSLLHCCERPVLRRKAMLGPPLHNGLYFMAWTVLAVWR